VRQIGLNFDMMTTDRLASIHTGVSQISACNRAPNILSTQASQTFYRQAYYFMNKRTSTSEETPRYVHLYDALEQHSATRTMLKQAKNYYV